MSTTTALPTRSIPSSHGPPVIGPLKDRLDYFCFQGPDTFFRSRMATHRTTVFRTNMPPTFPFFLGVDPRIVALLDCASFSSLFDLSLVDKRNVLIGDYMPSLKFTGNTRVVVYMDPSEPGHSAVKTFCLDLLKSNSHLWASEFLSAAATMLSTIESEVTSKGSSGVIVPLQKCIFQFLCRSFVLADSSEFPDFAGDAGFVMLDKWLAFQLLPTVHVPAIPQPLGELFLHSFPLPFFLAGGDYRKLYDFIEKGGADVIQQASKEYSLDKDQAIHNILFVLGFTAFGGFSVFLPSLISTLGTDKTGLADKLKEEVRRVVDGRGGMDKLGFEAVAEMELVRSTVYEVLRLNPSVPLQYGRARDGFVLRSHDTSYRVEKGELLCGYQPLAMRDPAVFDEAEEFRPERFVGAGGKDLLKYLFWSNGPETATPSTGNKQCTAKDHVVATACLLVAEIYGRYDVFECDASLNVTKLERRAAV